MAARHHGRRDKRAAIAAAATELFIEKGFSSVTVEEIAQRAEISSRTFFRYFRGKGDVLVGTRTTHFERLRERVRVAPRRLALFEAMETIAEEQADYLEDEDFPRLIPVWAAEPEIRRRRSEVLHVEGPLLLAEDFATREGSSTPSPVHVLAARTLMTVLDESLTTDVAEGRASYRGQVVANLRSWRKELERWVASSIHHDAGRVLSLP